MLFNSLFLLELCKIMSVLIFSFASLENTFAAIPGLSGTPKSVIFPSFLEDVIPEIFTFSIVSPFILIFSLSIPPAFSLYWTIVPVESSNDERKCIFIPYFAAISTDLGCSTFAPEAANSSIS